MRWSRPTTSVIAPRGTLHRLHSMRVRTHAAALRGARARSPSVMTGMSHSLPARGPAAMGCVHSRMSTAATMSLSATGSRKAPKAEYAFCTCVRRMCGRCLQGLGGTQGGCREAVHACNGAGRQGTTHDAFLAGWVGGGAAPAHGSLTQVRAKHTHQFACQVPVEPVCQRGHRKDSCARDCRVGRGPIPYCGANTHMSGERNQMIQQHQEPFQLWHCSEPASTFAAGVNPPAINAGIAATLASVSMVGSVRMVSLSTLPDVLAGVLLRSSSGPPPGPAADANGTCSRGGGLYGARHGCCGKCPANRWWSGGKCATLRLTAPQV